MLSSETIPTQESYLVDVVCAALIESPVAVGSQRASEVVQLGCGGSGGEGGAGSEGATPQ